MCIFCIFCIFCIYMHHFADVPAGSAPDSAVPINPSQESVEAAKHAIDGRTRTRIPSGPGPISMCTTGPGAADSEYGP
jgi:hypothetical protein